MAAASADVDVINNIDSGKKYPISFHYFGEATKLPITIQKAAFSVASAPTIGQHLVQMELTIVNECVEQNISGKLHMPLPPDSTVSRFEFFRGESWYPAVPVEAKKAKEVVYKEKEKGRNVASTAQAQGSTFEIEVSPLPYKVPSKCRLWYCSTSGTVPFDFGDKTEVTVSHTEGSAGMPPSESAQPSTCVGDCFGQRHFACRVPFRPAVGTVAVNNVCLLWDVSGSRRTRNFEKTFEKLRALAQATSAARFTVVTIGVTVEVVSALPLSVDEAIQCLQKLSYDGGSNLSGGLPQAYDLDVVAKSDAVLFFSDGQDSLDRRAPTLPSTAPRTHCVIEDGEVNLPYLASVAMQTGGQLLRGELQQMLRQQTMLASITTDQSDEDFTSGEDGFICVPDHRLNVQWPIDEDGLWITGRLGSGVSKMSVEVKAGSNMETLEFDFTTAAVLSEGAAPLLGYLFAKQQYTAVERDGALMGIDLESVRTNLALKYGFCSKESSLLMLYDPEQFAENGIPCPPGHPAYRAWKASFGKSSDAPTEVPKGEIGQRKTEEQFGAVQRLAKELDEYIQDPIPKQPIHAPLESQMMARGVMPNMAMAAGGVQLQSLCFAAAAPAPQREMMAMSGPPSASEEECEAADFDLFDAPESRSKRCAAPPGPSEDSLCLEAGAAPMEDQVEVPIANMSERRPDRETGDGPVVTDCEAYVAGKEQSYLKTFEDLIKQKKPVAVVEAAYLRLKEENLESPSFYLYTAGLFYKEQALRALAVRVCTNCLEISVQDVQMMRSVGYFLLKAGTCSALALDVLDHVQALAPGEPQSFLDAALARTMCLLRDGVQEATLKEAIELAAKVVTHVWANRFSEIEWPALVLLHLLMDLAGKAGLGDLWPLDAKYRIKNFSAGLVVWLGWDTDNTDIDLHIKEPSGNEVYYSNKRSSIGGHISKDFTQGYGPEVYLLKDPPNGKYTVKAKYYASHQVSNLTGTTSAVIWALQSEKGKKPQLHFDTVRLDRNKEMMEVMDVNFGSK
mmetsp:Transcript_16265/g.35221  ORF Transcript_16265/g.35221 Transcript_16265/m.35221 type:complete len:1016 (+) Transcript_16265:305-3352(+)